MNRPAALYCALAIALAGTRADASTSGFNSSTLKPPTTMSQLAPAGWRGFKTDMGRELAFSSEGPGPSTLSLSCKEHDMRIEIRAPAVPGATSSAAIRLTSGGFVRVFFAKQVLEEGSDGTVVARAPTNDEMLQMFRKTGRMVAGRTPLLARTPAEKSAIEDFFAACA
jgi:hypothetical protein